MFKPGVDIGAKGLANDLVGFLGMSSGHTALMTFDSTAPADNSTTQTAWLNSIGITNPQYLVDFESGFTDGQNINNTVIAPWLTISYDGGVTIESGTGSIAGSSPIGTFAAEFGSEGNGATLTFSTPVDYLGFYDIDKGSATITVSFVGGGSVQVPSDATGGTGSNAEFFGLYRNDQPRITQITFSNFSGGTETWGIDNIQYGVVPEPAETGLIAACMACLVAVVRRRLWKR